MSWKTVNLGELVDNFSVRAKDHLAVTSELVFFGVSNEDGITKSKYAAEDKAEDYKIIEKDCFAYNPYRINVGSIGLLEEDSVGLISPAYVVFKPKPKSIIPQLLLKFLKSAEGLRQIKLYARGTVRQALRFEDLCKIKLALPDYEEQLDFFKRIEESEIESTKISTELTHQLDLLKQLRQAFLREAMQGKLVPQDSNDEPASVLLEKIKAEKERLIKEKKIKKQKPLPPITEDEIPFEIPENWVLTRVGEVCTKVTDGFHHTPKKLKEGKIYISATHIREYGIDWDNCQFVPKKEHDELFKKAYPQKGEILITNRGAGCATPAIIDIDDSFSFQNAALIGFNQSLMSNRFLFYFILKNRDDIMDYFVNGGLQPMLSNVVLSKIPLPLPPLSEQQRIVDKLDELMQYCDDLEASIKESKQQNELLLQQVLREALEPKN